MAVQEQGSRWQERTEGGGTGQGRGTREGVATVEEDGAR